MERDSTEREEMIELVIVAAQTAADVAKWCEAGWLGALAKTQASDYREQERDLLRVVDYLQSLPTPP